MHMAAAQGCTVPSPASSSQGSGRAAPAVPRQQCKQVRPSRGSGAAGEGPAQASAAEGARSAPRVIELDCTSGDGSGACFRVDRAAVRRHAAVTAPHTGGALELEHSWRNLDGRGRAHSILRVLDLPQPLSMSS